MTDIVERLRKSVTKGHEPTDELAIEAADEIERLRAIIRDNPFHPAEQVMITRLEQVMIARLNSLGWTVSKV